MKHTKKLLIALVIVLLAGVVVPNIVPVLNSTISVEASSVRMNTTKKTLYVKKTYTLKVVGTKKKVKWSSSNKSVATVSSKGKVTAKKKGTATITAKVGNKKYTCKITVKTAQINKTAITLYRGNGYTLKVLGATTKVKWSSSNKSVATVNSKGQVTAKKKGTATITAKMGSKKYKCKVTVKNPYIKKTKLNFYPYEQYLLCVYGRTSAKWKKSTKWTSSNKSVATVTSKGRVTALKKGTATITATFGKEKYTCTVNVNGYVENKEAVKTGKELLDYTNGDILKTAKLGKWEKVGEWNRRAKILDYKNDFEAKYTANFIKNWWYARSETDSKLYIKDIDGEKYIFSENYYSYSNNYIGEDVYVKSMTEDRIVLNSIAYYTFDIGSSREEVLKKDGTSVRSATIKYLKNSGDEYWTKSGEIILKKESGEWKIDKYPTLNLNYDIPSDITIPHAA